MTETRIDIAHAAMSAAPEDDVLRLRFYESLAETELFLLLDGETTGEDVKAATFETSSGPFVLVFDTEERLAAFSGEPAPYAALSGRAIASMLGGAGLGIALNPDVAPSAFLVPPDAVEWLSGTLATPPVDAAARPVEIAPPASLSRALLEALDRKLATAGGLAKGAYLAEVRYDDGVQTLLLALIAPAPGAQPTLARAVSEALVFSGAESSTLDVAFFPASDPITERLARVGISIDLPKVETPHPPGRDPDTPPRLR